MINHLFLESEAAYDSVPLEAVYSSFRRIKAPEHVIEILKGLERARSISVETPFGLTSPYKPIHGLPQGSILSPLLWNIFYDPLLCLLQNETEGFKMRELKVTAVAYADDLHPISTSLRDLQKQLDIIHNFLALHNMRMGLAKTHILTNVIATSNDFPNNQARGLANRIGEDQN